MKKCFLYNKLLQFLISVINQLKALNPGDGLIANKEDDQLVKDTTRFRANRKKM